MEFPAANAPDPMKNKKVSFLNPFRRDAFSLVELVLAIGITVFVLVTLIGFLALGVQTAADSRDDSIASLLAENLRTELVADRGFLTNPPFLSFGSSNEDVGDPVYFDFNGGIIDQSEGARYLALVAQQPRNQALSASMQENSAFRYWESSPEPQTLQRLYIRIFGGPSLNREITSFSLVRAVNP